MKLLSELSQLIEWGGGGRSTDRLSDRGYTDAEAQKVTRSRGRKKHVNYVMTEGHDYTIHDNSWHGDSIFVQVMINHPDDDYYSGEEYHGINVVFDTTGKIKGSTYDSKARKEWKEDRETIITTAKDYVQKHLMRKILEWIKDAKPDDFKYAKLYYNILVKNHFDYPPAEIAALKKSIDDGLKRKSE